LKGSEIMTRGIPFEHWSEIQAALMPYIKKTISKEITFEEYEEIRESIYQEFIEKYS
jgi:hypothetical protein